MPPFCCDIFGVIVTHQTTPNTLTQTRTHANELLIVSRVNMHEKEVGVGGDRTACIIPFTHTMADSRRLSVNAMCAKRRRNKSTGEKHDPEQRPNRTEPIGGWEERWLHGCGLLCVAVS